MEKPDKNNEDIQSYGVILNTFWKRSKKDHNFRQYETENSLEELAMPERDDYTVFIDRFKTGLNSISEVRRSLIFEKRKADRKHVALNRFLEPYPVALGNI